MIKPHQFIVNGNGDTYTTLVDQYRRAARALYEAQGLVCLAYPHGRNYQTVAEPGAYLEDRKQHEADLAAIGEIISRLDMSARRAYDMKR